MVAIKLDGVVYATFETEDEALEYVAAYLGYGQEVVSVEAFEPEE